MVEEVPVYADGNPVWEQATTWHYEPESFVPLAKQTHNNDQLYYVVTDHLGTPRELVTEQGAPVWQQQYSVWGKALHRAANDDAIDCNLRFQGQYFDAESGLHYNYHRYYDPESAQYLTPDPIGLLGGMRPQGYVDNPNGWIDPLGLAKEDCEVYYRTMSKKHYERLKKSGKMPATGETMISPTQSFAEGYEGVLVKFTLKPGTTSKLEAIGTKMNIPTNSPYYPQYGDLPDVSTVQNWNTSNAVFKQEPNKVTRLPQINIGLGKGPALDIFNSNIVSYEAVGERNGRGKKGNFKRY